MIAFLSRLALRNLGRHRRRTILVGLGVALGVTVVTIQGGLVAGVRHQMIDRLVASQFGHLTLVPFAGAALIDDPDLPGATVRRVLPDARVVPSLSSLGMAFGEFSGSGRVALWGVGESDPMLTERLSTPPDLSSDRVYVGSALAAQLEAAEGDLITLSVVDPEGNLDAMDFEIAGILEAGAPWQDYFVYLPIEQLQSLMGVGASVSALKIYLDEGIDGAAAAVTRLNAALGNTGAPARAETYEKTGRLFMGIIAASSIQARVIEIILLIAVALGVGSAQILSVHERRREIGTMRALGTSRGAIRLLFLAEGLLLSSIAGTLGAIFGAGVTGVLGSVGIETGIEAFRWMVGGVRLEPRVDMGAVGWVLVELTVVVTLAGLYPALRAARLTPTSAMQEAA